MERDVRPNWWRLMTVITIVSLAVATLFYWVEN